jgi:t-SNARE complex subunit (syntaxin)
MDRLTNDKISRYLDDFSRERTELMRELKEATTVANEKPIRDKLTLVQTMEDKLLKFRTVLRKEQEKIM